jgi:hypothetical protein
MRKPTKVQQRAVEPYMDGWMDGWMDRWIHIIAYYTILIILT